MIVISRELALAGLSDPLGTPVFGWQSFVTISSVTATGSEDANPISNVANPGTFNFWRALSTSPLAAQTVTHTDAVRTLDYVGIAGHNFGSQQIAVTVEVLDIDQSPPAWVEAVEQRIPADDTPLILRFVPRLTSGVRLQLAVGGAPPRIAVMHVGKLLVAQRGTSADHVPINLARQLTTVAPRSESGNYLGQIITGERRSTSFNLTMMDADWYRENFDPFVKAVRDRAFFFAWRPLKWPTDCGYCWLTSDPQPPEQFGLGTMSVDLALGGIAQ